MGGSREAGRLSTKSRARVIEALVLWLNESFAPEDIVIEADTELFKGGLIDSMRILELIAWTERETGRKIPDEQILMDNFGTPRRIAEVFAGE